MDVGAPELIIILVVVLVLFGGAKLPQLARSLGQAKTEFEKASTGAAASSEADRKGSGSKGAGSAADEPVTLTKDELAALIAERDAARAAGAGAGEQGPTTSA